MRVAGVEIGSSIAYAADTAATEPTEVKVSALGSTTFNANQSYKVVTDSGKTLATFTGMNVYTTSWNQSEPLKLTYTPSSDGTSGTITVEKGAIKDLTVFEKTTVTCAKDAGGTIRGGYGTFGVEGVIKLTGGGAAYSYSDTVDAQTGETKTYSVATAADSTGTLTYDASFAGLKINSTDGAKLSELHYSSTDEDYVQLSGKLDISELETGRNLELMDSSTITAGGGITITIPDGDDKTSGEIFYDRDKHTVTLHWKGAYDEIKITGDGKVRIDSDPNEPAGITIKSYVADEDLDVENIEAENLTVKTITATDHLYVDDTLTAENVHVTGPNGLKAGDIVATGDVTSDSDVIVTKNQLKDADGNIIKTTTGVISAHNVVSNNSNVSAASIEATGNVSAGKNLAANDVTAQPSRRMPSRQRATSLRLRSWR